MQTKALDRAAQFIKDTHAQEDKQRKAYAEALEEAKAHKVQTAKEVKAAHAAADPGRYHTAKEADKAAADAIMLFEDRLQAFESEPQMTPEQCDKMQADILAELATIEQETAEEFAGMIDTMYNKAKEVQAQINRGNEILQVLLCDLLKDPRALKYGGTFITQYRNNKIMPFVANLKGTTLYNEKRGK